MRKKEYIQKMEEFVSTGSYEVVKYDYTSRYQAQVKRVMKETLIFTEFKKITSYNIDHNLMAPTIRSWIKLYKDGRPIRPIVSFIGAAYYRLSKTISRILK